MAVGKGRWLAPALCSGVMLGGCGGPGLTAPNVVCAERAAAPILVYNLFLGRGIEGGGTVDDRAFADFLDRVVSPNLPDGYTVIDAAGAWLDADYRRTVRERSAVLVVALPDTPAADAAIARVREAYKIQFAQKAVGMTVRAACGSFGTSRSGPGDDFSSRRQVRAFTVL